MKKIISFLIISSHICVLFSQQIISGVVEDATNNYAPIKDAIIQFPHAHVFISSDSLGRFSITLPEPETFYVTHSNYELDAIYANDVYMFDSTQFTPAYFVYMIPKNNLFKPVTIIGTRVSYADPFTFTNISGKQLNENNTGQDMPMLLNNTTAAVATSDAGVGVGYTGIRIRGSDATRVNVTLNGVPFNDAESQASYWVDLPDFAASVSTIQIQRGVGTSSNGISAFGASINLYTNNLHDNNFALVNCSVGSFGLVKTSIQFGTGKINKHWYVEGRASKIYSNGYIDRAFADLFSFALTTAYKNKNYTSIVNIFSGKEKTYQAWGGVPEDSLLTNRTYNPYTYKNQTDNYLQTHYQWHHDINFSSASSLNITLHYTKGKGYYEQLENDQYFSDYGVENFIINDDTLYQTNLISQKWLDNDFYGITSNYKRYINAKLKLSAGAAYYIYSANHFGKVLWAEYAQPFGYDYTFYNTDAQKNDGNIFTQASYSVNNKIYVFADMQYRNIQYNFLGLNENGLFENETIHLNFFNPKIGFSYTITPDIMTYISFAKAGKEPTRDDYVYSSPSSRPLPEILYDTELGSRVSSNGWQLGGNLYYMYYKNQLILTGAINDVGEYTRSNVSKSYRAGIELELSKTFFSKLSLNTNVAFSKNCIPKYTDYVDDWDTGLQQQFTYSNATIAFSPAYVFNNDIQYIVFLHNHSSAASRHTQLSASFSSKYVSRQYIDNTTSDARDINPYFTNDFSLNYLIQNLLLKNISFTVVCRNIFNTQYESNAWVYRYIYNGQEQLLNGYFPQAGRNFVLSAAIEI